MDIRTIVLKQLALIVAEYSPLPFPEDVSDDMMLDEFWLDSVAFTSLLTGIETGFIPNQILRGIAFPRTIGELVQSYVDEASEKI
jgi:hypothetical protein